MVVVALAAVGFLLVLGAITGRSGGRNGQAGNGDGGIYDASSASYGDDSGHCHAGDVGGGDCGGDGGGGD